MQVRFKAISYAATFFIFDPVAVRAETFNNLRWDQSIDALSSDGRGIVCFREGLYECYFFILVDEALDDRLLNKCENCVTDALLRVPSGRFIVIGSYEHLTNVNCPDSFHPSMGQAVEVPTGNYRVDAFHLNWGDEAENEYLRRTRPGDKRIDNLLFYLSCAVVVATIFVAPVVCLVTLIIWSWRDAALLLTNVIFLNILYWHFLLMFTGNSKAFQRIGELRDTVKSEFPDVVIVLRRCADSELPTTMTPGRFGAGC